MIGLKFQNDLSYQQIAEIMQTTANNVGVPLHTALKMFESITLRSPEISSRLNQSQMSKNEY